MLFGVGGGMRGNRMRGKAGGGYCIDTQRIYQVVLLRPDEISHWHANALDERVLAVWWSLVSP